MHQSGITLTGFIVFLIVFIAFAFSAGWFANKYYAHRLFLSPGTATAFPDVIYVDAKPGGLTWDGQNFIFANQASPWGIVRVTPLENGQFRKTTIPVVDNIYQQQVTFKGISWNGQNFVAITNSIDSAAEHKRALVTLDPVTHEVTVVNAEAPDYASCITWDGANYWIGTMSNTETQYDQLSALYKFNENLKLVATYEVSGRGCQGLTWDGKFLWLVDDVADTLSLYNISKMPPTTRHQYKLSSNHPAGITYDGTHIWLANQNKQQLMRLQQDLYLDWLGERFEITDASQMKLFDRFGILPSVNSRTDGLISSLVNGEIPVDGIPGYIENLRKHFNNNEIRQLLSLAREKIQHQDLRDALRHEIENLVDRGQVEYVNDTPVNDESVSTEHFRAVVENGKLVASWKIVAGSGIVSGVDAARPLLLPEDHDFDTFIRYRIIISDQQSAIEKEIDYDIFGDFDIQNDIVLLEDIKPGEYKIDIVVSAQYYTETQANHYQNNLVIKVNY